MKNIHGILFLFLSQLVLGQHQSMTAEQILDSSIVFCGKFKPKTRSELTYGVLMPDNSTAIIDEKRIEGEKYTQCILSMTHVPQTTFFDGKTMTRINGDSINQIKKIKIIDEIKLKTYSNLQFGYKQLEYKLERKEDIKFNHFDCYVLEATSKNGYTTLNYFDKENFRLLMVIYPNGNKSLMIEYEFRDSTLINTHIANIFPNSSEIQTLKLAKYKSDGEFSNLWFICPYEGKVNIPEYIKTGKFQSTNGPDTKFIRTSSSQDYFNHNGEMILKRYLKWSNSDCMVLISEDNIKRNNTNPESNILVRIISWDSRRYLCQWLAGKYSDTQDYKLVK